MPAQGRTQKALLNALLNYGQFLAAIVAAFFVTPVVLRHIEPREYGLWLSTGEIVGYFLLLDFGVASVLPWLIARADGAQQAGALKQTLAQAAFVSLLLAAVLVLMAFALWESLPWMLRMTVADWRQLCGPLAWLVALMAVNLPLNLFNAILVGLQDVGFRGWLNLFKCIGTPLLTVGLLLTGHGLYSLALGTALLSPFCGLAAAAWIQRTAPEVLRGWPWPTPTGAYQLFRESIGAWLGGAGVQLMERSNGVVLTMQGRPARVPTLICTGRASQILTQMTWVMPDSAMVGYAQLGGENNPVRSREVAVSLLRLTLLLAGLSACIVLAINPAFVRVWVGESYFGGMLLNTLLATEIVTASMVHVLVMLVGVRSHRLHIGLATLLQGTIYVGLAIPLARLYSMPGLLAADLLAPLCSTLPASLSLLSSVHELGWRRIGEALRSILLRAAPCLLGTGWYGWQRAQAASLPELIAAGLLISFIYLRVMGTELGSLPLPVRARTWLQRCHFLPN